MPQELFSELPLDQIIDTLEQHVTQSSLTMAEPLPAGKKIDAETIKYYFSSLAYPYKDQLDLHDYYRQKLSLQVELVKLQNWVGETGKRVAIVFEGRDAAGKGSTIRAFMEHLNPRRAKVVALEKPTDEERGQWYFQRYIKALPSSGQITFFDRSWYNRAGVERVMGFCSEADYQTFLAHAPVFEKMLVESGITLIKLYLSVSPSEQARRFEERKTNPLKQWKLSPIDMLAQHKWDDYTEAKNTVFEETDSEEAPWIIVKTEQKMRGRIEAMRFVLNQFEYDDKDPDAIGVPDPLIVTRAQNILDDEGKSHMVD